MILKMFQIDTFSEAVFGGNPAAALLLEDRLPDQLMQSIANENNLAETAFVKPSGDHWALRWFTLWPRNAGHRPYIDNRIRCAQPVMLLHPSG